MCGGNFYIKMKKIISNIINKMKTEFKVALTGNGGLTKHHMQKKLIKALGNVYKNTIWE